MDQTINNYVGNRGKQENYVNISNCIFQNILLMFHLFSFIIINIFFFCFDILLMLNIY